MQNLGIFIITFFIIFSTYFIPKNILNFTFMEKFQYFELFFVSILIIFLFGYFLYLITDTPSYLNNSFNYATFFLIWYFLTKSVLNSMNRDKNLVIRF